MGGGLHTLSTHKYSLDLVCGLTLKTSMLVALIAMREVRTYDILTSLLTGKPWYSLLEGYCFVPQQFAGAIVGNCDCSRVCTT